MSGDVQPRKRKDKKKKRDGGERKSEGELTFSRQSSSVQGDESSHGVHITKMGADDVHLHVQHDHGTGGHWCAKIMFFFLMTILVGLVGLIIMENRDSTDVDTPLSESRFSTYFDGWVDEHRQDDHAHDDDDDDKDMLHHDADEHGLDEDHDGDDHDDQEHEDHDEHEDDGGDKGEHQEDDEDEDEDDDEENGENDPERITITEDEDDEAAVRINLKADDDNEDEEDGDENNDDTDDNMDEDQDNDDDDNNGDNDDNEDEDEDDNDDNDDDDEDFDDENDDDQIVDNDAGELELLQEKARQQAAAQAAKYKSLSDEKENDDNEDNDDNEEADEVPSWANSLLIKIGIGFALAFVARVVLIKKNTNSSKVTEHAEVLLQRRLTIATEVPPGVPLHETQEVAIDVTTTVNENDYSNEEVEEEIVEEIEYIDEQDVEWAGMEAQVDAAESYKAETFEELSAMYRPKIDDNFNKTMAIEDSRAQGKTEETIEKQENIQQSSRCNMSSQESKLQQIKPDKLEGMETRSEKESNFNDNEKMFTKPEDLASAPLNSNENREDSTSIIKNEIEYDEDDIYEDDIYEDDDDDAEIEDNDSEALVDEDLLDEGGDSEEEEADGEEDTDEEDDEIEGDISDIDDTELMNRLEAKYGKLPAKNDSYSEEEDNTDAVDTWTQIKPKKNGGPKTISSDEYDNDYDIFEKELRQANEEMMRKSYKQAVPTLKKLKEKYPKRPEIYLSLARALDAYADQQKSNELLMSAIQTYQQYLQYQPKKSRLSEYKETGKRCLERMTFLGQYQQAVPLHKQLIQQFPQDVDFHNQLVITYILMDRISDAKLLLKEILQKWPTDGVAAVHYGFILKQYDKDLKQAAIYLESGIASRAEGTQDGRFFFHLGDALHRLGKPERAYQIYKDAVALKLFPSVYQRSLYNEPNLRAQPFWSKTETGYRQWLEKLEKNWLAIRAEGLNALSKLGYYQNETENLRNKGEWQQFELYSRGQQRMKNCLKAPITCSMIAGFPAARDCRRGQVKFSVMQSGTHVWPHCGPTNCRLRAHLGLVVPPNTVVRVAEEENTWQEGKFLIFDDSFEHEVWHNGSSLRLVLIIDVWHPDLTVQQRRSLSPL